MATARFAWFLNLDADVELAAIATGAAGARTGYSPKQALVEATRRFGPSLAARLIDPDHDVVIDEAAPPGSARGLVGRAFCPTPRALRVLVRAGAVPEPSPDVDVLVRVNARSFCASLGQTLAGAAFVTTEADALAHLASSPPSSVAQRWRIKRNFGMTGRGQRVVDPANVTEADRVFLRAGLSEGGVQIEPDVRIVYERAVHGFLLPGGSFTLGPVVQQRCDARGAWLASDPLPSPEAPKELVHEAERVAAALQKSAYFGPFGVDSYGYEDDGDVVLQPRSEINARYTMGFAAATPREARPPAPL